MQDYREYRNWLADLKGVKFSEVCAVHAQDIMYWIQFPTVAVTAYRCNQSLIKCNSICRYICMYICTYVQMYECMYKCMYKCTNICTNVRIYVQVYARMYV